MGLVMVEATMLEKPAKAIFCAKSSKGGVGGRMMDDASLGEDVAAVMMSQWSWETGGYISKVRALPAERECQLQQRRKRTERTGDATTRLLRVQFAYRMRRRKTARPTMLKSCADSLWLTVSQGKKKRARTRSRNVK